MSRLELTSALFHKGALRRDRAGMPYIQAGLTDGLDERQRHPKVFTRIADENLGHRIGLSNPDRQ